MSLDEYFGRSGSEEIHIAQGPGGIARVIKKKPEPLPEMYANETELKKEANKLLEKLPRCKLLKTDNMALRVGNGRKAKTRNPGMSDHHLCIVGRFVAIEAKMPGNDLDSDQIDYQNDVLAAGGIFIVYHSLKELVFELKRHRLISRKFEILY